MSAAPPFGAAEAAALRARLAALQTELRALRPHGPPVRLLAASKRQPVAALATLYDAGVRDFAENYVQELVAKAAALAASGRRPTWHLVGQLQRNKVAQALQAADWVHSVDNAALIARLGRLAAQRPAGPAGLSDPAGSAGLSDPAGSAGLCDPRGPAPLPVLLQVRLGGDAAAARGGCPPEGLWALADAVLAQPALRLAGLMGLPPPGGDAAASFAALAQLGATLRRRAGAADADALSMGMSADFAPAVRAGATMVRLGTALFGPR